MIVITASNKVMIRFMQIPIYLNKLTNSSIHQQTRAIVCPKNDDTPAPGFIQHLIEYQVDKPLENHQNWFDNCPVARTRKTPAIIHDCRGLCISDKAKLCYQ